MIQSWRLGVGQGQGKTFYANFTLTLTLTCYETKNYEKVACNTLIACHAVILNETQECEAIAGW